MTILLCWKDWSSQSVISDVVKTDGSDSFRESWKFQEMNCRSVTGWYSLKINFTKYWFPLLPSIPISRVELSVIGIQDFLFNAHLLSWDVCKWVQHWGLGVKIHWIQSKGSSCHLQSLGEVIASAGGGGWCASVLIEIRVLVAIWSTPYSIRLKIVFGVNVCMCIWVVLYVWILAVTG